IMEKFKGYIGVAAGCLILLLLYPIGNLDWPNKDRSALTPFDNTLITQLTIAQSSNWRLRNQVTNFLANCDYGDNTPKSPEDFKKPRCIFLLEHVNPILLIETIYQFKNTAGGLNEETIKRLINFTTHRPNHPLNPIASKEDAAYLNERLALSRPVGKILAKSVDEQKIPLTIITWGINLAVVCLAIATIMSRRFVGGLITKAIAKPIVAILRALRVLKKIHERI